MKSTIMTLILLWLCSGLHSQLIENDLLDQQWHTHNTSSTNKGKWTKIATCTNNGSYADFGTIFELFGNGSSNSIYYYGKLIARFKRQSSTQGPATSMSLILFNSNIGKENIVGIRNGPTIDIYLKINMTYTRYNFRRIILGSSLITALSNQPFLTELPEGDYAINCEDGSISSNRLNALSSIIDGKLEAKEIKVTTAPGADFVFEENYHLKDLSEVEAFIKTNKHLPEIPTAAEMEESGVNLAEMNKLLLMKVEELTLYAIKQKAEADSLKKELIVVQKSESNLQKRFEKMKKELEDRLLKLEKQQSE
ncbi:MAG: hypothetical protein N4A74_22240 [Carboxylicivirga sp.]|jgi:hypothetical protein|nr:hypothetical protein [Carboxylicivirga sp.]